MLNAGARRPEERALLWLPGGGITLVVVTTTILIEWLFDLRYPYVFDLHGPVWRVVSLVSVVVVYTASVLTLWLRWSGRLAVAPSGVAESTIRLLTPGTRAELVPWLVSGVLAMVAAQPSLAGEWPLGIFIMPAVLVAAVTLHLITVPAAASLTIARPPTARDARPPSELERILRPAAMNRGQISHLERTE